MHSGSGGDFTYIKQACVCMCFSVKRESLSINFVTDHELGHDYAYQTFKRLVKPGSDHAEDIQSLWLDVKFPGNKQKPTPAMTIRGLQRLLMMLSNIKNMKSLARSHTHAHTHASRAAWSEQKVKVVPGSLLDMRCLTCVA